MPHKRFRCLVAIVSLAQELLAAKGSLQLPRELRTLDHFAVLIPDDVGQIHQSPEEAEVLFTPAMGFSVSSR